MSTTQTKFRGEYVPATRNCVARTLLGDYVVSHWPHGFVLSYRPKGKHVPMGTFPTLQSALAAATGGKG